MDRDVVVAAYEDLRGEVVHGTADLVHRSAMSLFARGGMLEWVCAWTSCVDTPAPLSDGKCAGPTTIAHDQSPSASKAEATVILAGMVLQNILA